METLYVLMILTGIICFRYILVHFQSRRALKLAAKKTVELIRQCENGLAILNRAHTLDPKIKNKMKQTILRTVRRAGNDDDLYWAMYYKDFDYNELWLNPMKWTLGQMYPNLTEVANIGFDIEGKPSEDDNRS
jgi:hypothetical protein